MSTFKRLKRGEETGRRVTVLSPREYMDQWKAENT